MEIKDLKSYGPPCWEMSHYGWSQSFDMGSWGTLNKWTDAGIIAVPNLKKFY